MLNAELGHLYSTISALEADSIAVAFSGGGDSTALLHALRDFPNVRHAFIIDHNLRDESAHECDKAAGFALDLGYDVKIRRWDHDNPIKGIQVKAREYRYAAMGELCRQAGVTHLLTGHTQDDQAETLLMRQERGTGWRGLAGIRHQAYGPLWPALAEVTLVRPLLNVSRLALRDYNRAEGLLWIDDPSNENRDYTRVRARQALTQDVDLKQSLLEVQSKNTGRLMCERRNFKDWMSKHAKIHGQGFVELDVVPPAELCLHILRIASGTGGPIDAARRDALCEQMKRIDFKAATLAGAWVLKSSEGFLVTRDKVAVQGRRNLKNSKIVPVELSVNSPITWDGRFIIKTHQVGVRVEPAFGVLQKLREHIETKEIFNLSDSVRPTLPVYFQGGDIIGFGSGEWSALSAQALASKRFEALWS